MSKIWDEKKEKFRQNMKNSTENKTAEIEVTAFQQKKNKTLLSSQS